MKSTFVLVSLLTLSLLIFSEGTFAKSQDPTNESSEVIIEDVIVLRSGKKYKILDDLFMQDQESHQILKYEIDGDFVRISECEDCQE